MTNNRPTTTNSDVAIRSDFESRASSSSDALVKTPERLASLLPLIEPASRVAVDTEADSLHCYREKLCLLQISVPDHDFLVDPLAGLDLSGLAAVLQDREIVLQGADFDLRLLRRTFEFRPRQVFDTVIAARLLGVKEFSLAALILRYFGVELSKGSQKANWAQRPLPSRMIEYAMNDTHYLLPLAAKLEAELEASGRRQWFEQSCRRALEQAFVDRVRDAEEAWRISGSGRLRGRTAAVLRALWHWREAEAKAVDRPPFHILQNRDLVQSAEKFAAGQVADYRHFSVRRRQAFRDAAAEALRLPESEWPVGQKRTGTRPTTAIIKRTEELKERRDRITGELGLEPAFVAPRSTLEAIAADPGCAKTLLTSWQCELLEVER